MQDAYGQPGDDGGMFVQRILEHLAVLIIVIERTNLGKAAEAFKGLEIELVDVRKMGIGDHDVGQRLDVAQAVGDTSQINT